MSMSVPQFLKNLVIGSDEDEDYGYEEDLDMEEDQDQFDEETQETTHYSDRRSTSVKEMNPTSKKVVGLPGVTNANAEVMVIEPRTFEEMPKVIDSLRERKSVVLNLEMMDPQEAQRAVDFVSGGTYAMDGHYERVGESIFLFTPSCVTVSNLSGLISGADDFSTARNRRPKGSSIDPWVEQPHVAMQ